MTLPRLVLRSLWHYRRTHGGVFAGVLLAAAILTGALVVGDSARHSLHTFALDRLGSIQFALDTRARYIAEDFGEALQDHLQTPVIVGLRLRAVAIRSAAGDGGDAQAGRVNVMGIPGDFWEFASDRPGDIAPREAVLNERLASVLGVNADDEIGLRIEKPGLFSRDAPLSARDDDTAVRARCVVKAIVPDSGLGRFSLSASQTPPYNAFVSLDWLQTLTGLEDRANLVLVGGDVDEAKLDSAVRDSWQPEHIGLRFRQHPSGVLQIESERVFLDEAVAKTALDLPGAEGTLTYLVNSIARGDRSTPYSFVEAGPVPDAMPDDAVLINEWLAAEIGAGIGDDVAVTYYELDPSNQLIERQQVFTVAGVAGMDDLSIERDLAPQFPGLSDVERCADWSIGMPLDEELLNDPANEAYWKEYGQTPKALFTKAAGKKMWAGRFGDLMAVRYPTDGPTQEQIRRVLREGVDPAAIGLRFAPVREEALQAVAQAIDLGGLFLGMSFFLIVAALILTALLFVFGVQQRAGEMGLLLALGFSPSQVRRLLFAEAFLIALLGSVAGAFAGILYTRILIESLTRFWQGAVAHAPILFHVAPATLGYGAAISAVCSAAALVAATWRQTRHTARELLVADFTQDRSQQGLPGRIWLLTPVAGFLAGAAIAGYALLSATERPAGFFFAAGAIFLSAGVILSSYLLALMDSRLATGNPTLLGAGIQNASRRRGRSLSVVALLATGCFLVLAVSSMQEDIAAHADERWSGTGGFEFYAESTLPLLEVPSSAAGNGEALVIPIRVRDGDDASCLNLNRAQVPRLLGVDPETLAKLNAFEPRDSPGSLWPLLDRADLPGGAIPALVGDSDTALWGLMKKTGPEDGDILTYQDEAGRNIAVKLVGKLPMRLSVFQGTILVSNRHFTRLFPSEEGFRAFLIDVPSQTADEWISRLTRDLRRFAFEITPSVDRLRDFYVVERTYLSMFLVLGGLGMIVGSAAMGIVVLRNLIERRREIAILRALGFRERAVFAAVCAEYGFLLLLGIALGAAAAAVSMVPALSASGAGFSLEVQGLVLLLVTLTGMACILAGVKMGLGRVTVSALRDE